MEKFLLQRSCHKEAKSKSEPLRAASVPIPPAGSSKELCPPSQETSHKTKSSSVDNRSNASIRSTYTFATVCDASWRTSENENSKSATTLPQLLTSDPSSVELDPKKEKPKDVNNDIYKTKSFEKYHNLLSDLTKQLEMRGKKLFPTMWCRNASTGNWIKHTPYDSSTTKIEYFSEQEKESYRIWFKKISTGVEIAEVTEEMEIPADIDFCQLEYVRQFYPDPIPLMPAYRKYETRIRSFNILSNTCIDEIELLAKLGFYFLGCHCLGRPVLNVRSKDLEAYNYDAAACFCCGSCTPIFYKYPRPEPAAHYLHCALKLPKDRQYMKDSVIPFTKKDELDFRLKKSNSRPVPKCLNCREEEWEMKYYPCEHGKFCISCAKSEPTCLRCKEIYTGIIRTWY